MDDTREYRRKLEEDPTFSREKEVVEKVRWKILHVFRVKEEKKGPLEWLKLIVSIVGIAIALLKSLRK